MILIKLEAEDDGNLQSFSANDERLFSTEANYFVGNHFVKITLFESFCHKSSKKAGLLDETKWFYYPEQTRAPNLPISSLLPTLSGRAHRRDFQFEMCVVSSLREVLFGEASDSEVRSLLFEPVTILRLKWILSGDPH